MADGDKVEVGAAYVAIIPSARGFARQLRKDIAKEFAGSDLDKMVADALAGRPLSVPVQPTLGDVPDDIPVRRGREPKLPVRVDPLTAALQADVRRELATLTREVSAQVPVGADTDGLRTELADAISAVESTLTADVPTEPGDRREYERRLREQVDEVARTVRAKVAVDVDVDDPLRSGRVDAAGETVGRSLASSITGSLTSGLSAVSGPVVFAGLVAAAVVAGPLVGAAIAGGVLAVLGGGVIGLGIAALSQDPLFQRAASGLSSTIQQTLAKAAAPLLGTEDNPGPLLKAMEILGDLVVEIGPSLEQMFEAIGPSIPVLASGVADFVKAVMPGLVDAVEASGPILEAIAVNMKPLGESIGRFLTVMAELAPAAIDAISVLTTIITTVIDVAAGMIYILGAAFSGIYGWYESLRDRTKELWETVSGIFTTGGATVKQRVEAFVGAVIRLFRGLPGQIRNALGNLGSLLYQAGRNVVQGLIDGVRNMFGALGRVASSMAQIIRDHLPFSPAKTGPLSGRGNPYYSGRSIVDLLASGVTGNLSAADRAAADLAAVFATPSVPGYGLAAAAAPAPSGLRVEWVGGDGDPIVRALREHTRIYYGGSAQAALGS